MKNSLVTKTLLVFALMPLVLNAQEADLSVPPEEVISAAEEAYYTEVYDDDESVSDKSSAIEIAEYSAPQSGSIGLRSTQELQLPDNLWQKIPEDKAVGLINAMPSEVSSNAVKNMLVRLLVAETGRNDFGDAVLTARINKLREMGQVQLASKLLDSVPEAMLPFALQKEKFLLNTLASRENGAQCDLASVQQSSTPNAFWHRMKVICQAKEKKTAEAQLGLALLREQNNAPKGFDALVQGLLNDNKSKLSEVELADNDGEASAWRKLAGLAAAKDSSNVSLPPVPDDSSPQVALSLLNVKASDADSKKRKAFMAAQIRTIWQKPISIEVEEKLKAVQYRTELVEISPLWRSHIGHLIQDGAQLKALLTLLEPLKQSLSYYTIGDLGFVMQELIALGLANDATALAEEALEGE